MHPVGFAILIAVLMVIALIVISDVTSVMRLLTALSTTIFAVMAFLILWKAGTRRE
jgi:uncharacterized membrane protein YjgN (DUF898 family)